MNKRPYKSPSVDDVMALLQQAQQVGALSDPAVQALAKAVVMNPDDCGLSMMLRERIAPYLVNSQVNPDPLRPYPGLNSGLSIGNIPIGIIHETGIPYNLPLADLTHTLIVGPTGAGKTNFTYWMLHGLYRNVPVVVITSKSEARMLATPRIADVVVDIGELRISLFEPPPGMDPKHWAHLVVDLFCREYGLQFSRVPFNQVSDSLLQAFTALSRQRGKAYYPTLINFFDLPCRSRSKYAESVRTAIDGFVRATGPIFETARGISMERLLTQGTAVINIACIREDSAARVIVGSLISLIHEYWRCNGPNDGSVQSMLVLDDAHRFLAAQNEKNGVTTVSHMLQLARQAGLRFVLVSQSPCELSANVLSQTGCVFQVGSLHYERDVRAMASIFGLPPAGYGRLLNNAVGNFIAIENLNRYQGAFGGRVDLFPKPAVPVSEAVRRQAMQPMLAGLPFEPAVPTHQVMGGGSQVGQGAMPAKVPQMSQDALQLAINVIAYPFDFLSGHKARIGLIGGAWQRAKQELLDASWIREHTIPKRGQSPIVLEPLPALAAAVQRPLPSWGKGSYLHRFLQETIAKRLKALGYSHVALEKSFGSKSVDVVGTHPTQGLEGFECAVSLGNVVDNLEKDFICQPNFARITTICLSTSEEKQVWRAIAQAPALQPHQTRIAVDRVCNWI